MIDVITITHMDWEPIDKPAMCRLFVDATQAPLQDVKPFVEALMKYGSVDLNLTERQLGRLMFRHAGGEFHRPCLRFGEPRPVPTYDFGEHDWRIDARAHSKTF